jgi:hypothetical protein
VAFRRAALAAGRGNLERLIEVSGAGYLARLKKLRNFLIIFDLFDSEIA